VVTLAAIGCAYVMVHWSPALLVLLALAVWGAVTAWWMWREVLPPWTTKGMIKRRGDREQRAGGVASTFDLGERASRAAMLRQAHVMRPSLQRIRRRRIDPWAVASLVAVHDGRWGLRRLTRHWREVWVICRDATLRVGGPGTGKTVSLALAAARAPGALLTTSTRTDLAEWVHPVRRVYPAGDPAQAGQPRAVHVFNPAGYGDVPSTVRWSILLDCEDYAAAIRRAEDLIPESPSVDGERWDMQARLYLPMLLNAAAVGERGVTDVARWVRDIGADSTMERARRDIIKILAAMPGAEERIGLLGQLLSTNDKTRSSITSTMVKALAWVSDDTARQIGAAPLTQVTLDVRRLILKQETLHIIGPDSGGGMMRPLMSALVAEFAHQTRMLAAQMPGGRLDPPLTMALDEIAVAVHLPLDQWSADMGGRGIVLHLAAQSLSQLTERWGKAGAGVLLGNVGTLLLYGGGKDADELSKISDLCGSYRMRVVGEDHDGVDSRKDGERRDEWKWRPVLTPSDLSNLPPFHAACIVRNLGGVVTARTPTTLDAGMRPMSLLEPVPVVDEALAEETATLASLFPGEALA
jgi:type IV secretion system protein VirD4